MNKHMHEKTDPPLWKTVVLWQSIFSIFCGMGFSYLARRGLFLPYLS